MLLPSQEARHHRQSASDPQAGMNVSLHHKPGWQIGVAVNDVPVPKHHVLVNWLQMEVVQRKPLPSVIHLLKGWRNFEVFCYVSYEMPDWTVGVYRP